MAIDTNMVRAGVGSKSFYRVRGKWGQGLISDYRLTKVYRIGYEKRMARPWRIEYEGALYHVFFWQ
jgi:hypothetical protein